MHVREFAKKTHASSFKWTRHFRIFIVLIIFVLSIYDCFDSNRFSKSFHLFCHFVSLFDISITHLTSILVSQVVWTRELVDIELKNEFAKRRKSNWNKNSTKHEIKKYQKKNVVDISFLIKKNIVFQRFSK